MTECAFQPHVIVLDDQFNKDNFPERFSNEVYLSRTTVMETRYISPFTVKYVHQGIDHYKVNGRHVLVEEGDVFVANDGSDIELLGDNKRGNREFNTGMSLFVDTELVKDIYYTHKLKSNDIAGDVTGFDDSAPLFYDDVIKHDRRFTGYIKQLYQVLQADRNTPLDLEFYYRVCEHIMDFQSRTLSNYSHIAQKTIAAKKEILKRVAVAREVIDATGIERFDLGTVARQSCLSKYFLIKCFKQVYGITPHQFYLKNKIGNSIEMLRKTGRISDVAAALDYPSVQSFCRQFKKVTGITPVNYRKMIRS